MTSLSYMWPCLKKQKEKALTFLQVAFSYDSMHMPCAGQVSEVHIVLETGRDVSAAPS